MKEYLKRSSLFRGTKCTLLLSYMKPHKEISKDTIARWIKVILSRAGIDVSQFGAHSVRLATTSKAKLNSVPIDNILGKAGWSNVKTFRGVRAKKSYLKILPISFFCTKMLLS